MEDGKAKAPGASGVPWGWLLLLFAATVLLYLPTLPFSITNYDDNKYITDDPHIRLLDVRRVGELLTTTYFVNYHPLTLATYALDYCLVGLRPAAYRFQNILWHAGSVVVLAILLRRRFGAGSAAFLLAFLWGATPLRYESVVWLSERKDVLSVFFFLVAYALHCSADCMDRAEYARRVLPWEVAALILSLLGKSMAITYVGVIVAHDVLLARSHWRGRLPVYALVGAICAAFAAANVMAQDTAIMSVQHAGPVRRLALAVHAVWHHASRTILPVGLSPAHPLDFVPPILSARTGLGLLSTVVALAAAWRFRITSPRVTLGIAFFLVTLSPVSGVVPIGFSFVADRYSYLPTVGLFLAAGATLCRGDGWRSLALPAALAVGVLAARPVDSMFTWANSTSLWMRVLHVYPEFHTARLNIAGARLREYGKLPKASDISGVEDRLELGIAEQLQAQMATEAGDTAAAIAWLEKSPSEIVRIRGLARLHTDKGNHVEARRYALELANLPNAQPEDVGTAANLLIRIGDVDAAGEVLSRLRKPSLQAAQSMGQLANLLIQRGDVMRAEEWLRIAERIDPAQYDISRARSTLFVGYKDMEGGMDYCERILARPDVPKNTYQFLLGMYAYFAESAGNKVEALKAVRLALEDGTEDEATLKNAVRLSRAAGDADMLARATRRLEAVQARAASTP